MWNMKVPDPPLEPNEPEPNYPPCPVCGCDEPETLYYRGAECVGCDHCLTTKEYWEVEP